MTTEHKTELVSYGEKSAATLIFFAVGGSGMRTIEPLLHMCAAGLGPQRLELLLIDPDLSNAAVTKARELVDAYRKTRNSLALDKNPEGYFRTEVTSVVGDALVWSPIAQSDGRGDPKFGVRMARPTMEAQAAPIGQVFDLLFAQRFQEMDLTLGFRGVPSIGTVFMNRLREQPFFEQLLTTAVARPQSVCFAVGSVFGGTGAAALPVIGRALVGGIKRGVDGDRMKEIPGIPAERVGAALLMPFFTLPAAESATAPDGGPRPQANLFAQNTAAAMPSYANGDAKYSTIYALGDDEPRQHTVNSVGGAEQKNPADYVELYAALAALDFAVRGGGAKGPTRFLYTAVNASRGSARKNVGWIDLPLGSESLRRLKGAFVAAHSFLRIFRPDGKAQPELKALLKGAAWREELGLRGTDMDAKSPAFDACADYFTRMWSWASEMRRTNPAMDLIQGTGAPSTVDLDRTLSEHRARRPVTDDFEVFCHWNDAAYPRRQKGATAFWDVMRLGSESFADQRYEPTITTAEDK